MELTVEDNGNGMSDEAVAEIKANFRNSEIKGIGLKNVLKRFDLYYGEKFSFELSGSGGTRIKIKYPGTM